MSFESALYSYLSGHAGLNNLVSTKIFPDSVPQDTESPYIFYQEVYREKHYAHSGYVTSSEWSIQISSYATTKDKSRQVADQVSLAMDSWPGVNVKIGSCQQENEQSTWIEDLGLFVIDQDYLIHYKD